MASCSLTELRKQQLIHNDIVRINLIRSQLLYKPLRLVQREELGYAHANERRLLLSVR